LLWNLLLWHRLLHSLLNLSQMTSQLRPSVDTMADSDCSRSPSPPCNRQEQPGQRQAIPCFPRWCGPMGSAVRSLSTMPRLQNVPKWPPCRTMPQPFPPTPPSMPPPPIPCLSNLNVSPSQLGPISNSGTTEASRVYGFDLNENWQGDREQRLDLPQSDHHSKARH